MNIPVVKSHLRLVPSSAFTSLFKFISVWEVANPDMAAFQTFYSGHEANVLGPIRAILFPYVYRWGVKLSKFLFNGKDQPASLFTALSTASLKAEETGGTAYDVFLQNAERAKLGLIPAAPPGQKRSAAAQKGSANKKEVACTFCQGTSHTVKRCFNLRDLVKSGAKTPDQAISMGLGVDIARRAGSGGGGGQGKGSQKNGGGRGNNKKQQWQKENNGQQQQQQQQQQPYHFTPPFSPPWSPQFFAPPPDQQWHGQWHPPQNEGQANVCWLCGGDHKAHDCPLKERNKGKGGKGNGKGGGKGKGKGKGKQDAPLDPAQAAANFLGQDHADQ